MMLLGIFGFGVILTIDKGIRSKIVENIVKIRKVVVSFFVFINSLYILLAIIEFLLVDIITVIHLLLLYILILT